MSPEAAQVFLAEQAVVHLASVDAAGQPVFKTVHPILDAGWLWFHSAPAGEKMSLLGRPAVISCEDLVATVPSYFFDAERACPATTYYRSVQIHGVITPLDDGHQKARVLQAMMQRFQPEGWHQPIDAESDLYRAAVKGLLIAGVPLTSITGKAKLAQNRTPQQRSQLLQNLWHRGGPGDVRALELIRAANPDTPLPAFLQSLPGVTLFTQVPHVKVGEAVELLAHQYWNDRFSRVQLRRAHLQASAWVGAVDERGALIASARSISDEGKYAWVYDVVVAEAWQRKGLGQAVMRLLLEHPAVRQAARVCLGTRDAQSLYRRFGFVERGELPARPYTSTEMVLVRSE